MSPHSNGLLSVFTVLLLLVAEDHLQAFGDADVTPVLQFAGFPELPLSIRLSFRGSDVSSQTLCCHGRGNLETLLLQKRDEKEKLFFSPLKLMHSPDWADLPVNQSSFIAFLSSRLDKVLFTRLTLSV